MNREIGIAEVRHLARLSRLVLTEDEEKLLAGQFGQIIGHMDLLNSVDTTAVEPLYSPAMHKSMNREDESRDIRTQEEILVNAPETDGEYFIVPRIV